MSHEASSAARVGGLVSEGHARRHERRKSQSASGPRATRRQEPTKVVPTMTTQRRQRSESFGKGSSSHVARGVGISSLIAFARE
jgi:hypothetical protein